MLNVSHGMPEGRSSESEQAGESQETMLDEP
jgi:hypothetical protein